MRRLIHNIRSRGSSSSGVGSDIFSAFDQLTDELDLEKLKTVGDGYLAVGGLAGSNPDDVAAVADLALAMRKEAANYGSRYGPPAPDRHRHRPRDSGRHRPAKVQLRRLG
ncbi:MAG: adenylate/guanylate cyclase domain-containing protein [Acidimicrobiia bacterium]